MLDVGPVNESMGAESHAWRIRKDLSDALRRALAFVDESPEAKGQHSTWVVRAVRFLSEEAALRQNTWLTEDTPGRSKPLSARDCFVRTMIAESALGCWPRIRTDRDLALASLVAGSWPEDLDDDEPATIDAVVTLERVAVKKARQRAFLFPADAKKWADRRGGQAPVT